MEQSLTLGKPMGFLVADPNARITNLKGGFRSAVVSAAAFTLSKMTKVGAVVLAAGAAIFMIAKGKLKRVGALLLEIGLAALACFIFSKIHPILGIIMAFLVSRLVQGALGKRLILSV